jgi:hypothetical protein
VSKDQRDELEERHGINLRKKQLRDLPELRDKGFQLSYIADLVVELGDAYTKRDDRRWRAILQELADHLLASGFEAKKIKKKPTRSRSSRRRSRRPAAT